MTLLEWIEHAYGGNISRFACAAGLPYGLVFLYAKGKKTPGPEMAKRLRRITSNACTIEELRAPDRRTLKRLQALRNKRLKRKTKLHFGPAATA
jgi:hypothetical protein